ncbi:MAG TPA: hydroxymethylglutaryl-CoA synthase [Trebonia sp.]|jgi:polyketide biosynthesis 3-hydroxy-3-methylglutaryl-CoA synthase-like enzyme PksG|nr:hydroxymethylglutaryl-CoA synthase [Trebonia sp.]
MTDDRLTSVGIESVGVYCGVAAVDVPALFRARGLDDKRRENLMMRRKSVALPCEDVVTFAATAARPLLDALTPPERAAIELVVVGTESAVDWGRSASSFLHGLLGLGRSCRLFEVKQACYGGMAALQTACALIAASPRPGARALVVGADVASPMRETYMEPSQGAGAVALLVGRAPRVAVPDPGAYGCYSYDAGDGMRPLREHDIFDVDLSLLTYLDCLRHSWAEYATVVDGADIVDTFHRLALHTPFAGMVKGAHRSLLRSLRRLPEAGIEDDFAMRVQPSLVYPSEVGNIYSGTLLLALASSIEHTPDEGYRTGLFSYGSGCASEFASAVIPAGARAAVAQAQIAGQLDARADLSVAAYDQVIEQTPAAGTEDAKLGPQAADELTGGRLSARKAAVLSSVRGFRREYAWT